MENSKAVLIAGPTASGKSALALELAQQTGGVVINADSMQVYRDLRVLTARPTLDEEAQVPHRLYGHVDAAVNFSAGSWVADAANVLAEVRAQNRLPIFVGGSGLYFKALTRGLSAVPPIPAGDPRQRARAAGARRRRGAACRTGAARSGLRRTPETARSQPHRPRARGGRGDRAFADIDWHRDGLPPLLPPDAFRALFLAPDRDALYARIDARFDAMLQAGALDEVAALASRKLDPLLPAMKAHGVPALIRHLAGRDQPGGGGRDRPRRYPALRQAAVHLVPASTAGIRMGEAGGGEGMASDRHSGALVKRANPKISSSRVRDCRSASHPGMTAGAGRAWLEPANCARPSAKNPAKL